MFFSRRFLPLFLIQFLGAFSDNVFKTAMLMLTAFGLAQAQGWNPSVAAQLIGALFILPFCIFSGWAGYVSDIWERHTFIRRIKLLELFILLLGVISLLAHHFYGMLIAIAGLGLIAALFGPLKYGLFPTYLKENELLLGNAYFEAGTFCAILLGTLMGGLTVQNTYGHSIIAVVLLLSGLSSYLLSFVLLPAPAAAAVTLSPWHVKTLWISTKQTLIYTWNLPAVFRPILGISWFWCLGAVILSMLPTYVKTTLNAGETTVTVLLFFFAFGVGLGSFIGQKLSHGKITSKYVPLASLLISLASFSWTSFISTDYINVSITVIHTLLLGIAGGLYSVPLYTLMQHYSPNEMRGRIISANNLWNAIFMVLGAILAAAIAHYTSSPAYLLGALCFLSGLVTCYLYISLRPWSQTIK